MHEDEIARRVARYEHALLALATAKGTPITAEDEARAARVVEAVDRYEAAQQLARVRLPGPPVVTQGAPSDPSPRKRPRRRRPPSAPAAPRPRGRPRKTPEPPPPG